MPLESLLQNPNPEVPRSKSILSRFSNPLAKHARTLFDLSIEPEDPFKVYSPGEIVKGHIVLTVLKGFDITHLVVGLHGYARVYRHQITPGDGHPLAEAIVNGKGTRGFEYHGSGLASLFQEEQVLCGSGFLRKQVYKFAFEVHFPQKSMPSTIEFERGTVSYMISVTLTRPVTMMATFTKHKRIKFQDTIDIEGMNTPKSRVISLEPMKKRGKVKRVHGAASVGTNGTSTKSVLSRKNTQSSSVTMSTLGHPPLSPVPSDETSVTQATTSTQSFQQIEQGVPPRQTSPHESEARSSETSSSAHTITATTELPRHGALPGDSIPVRVNIVHNKPYVKGVVIATLYRLGRIDMQPEIPVANRKDKEKAYEDVYPRSKTGLGGLYFSNSAPNSAFRKDLSQSSTMMVINPATLASDITTSVKVPDTAFPTIANVPGGMISFTYHVEVVIDLFGKLGETRYLPRITSSDPTFTHTQEAGKQLTSEWSNNILDTSQLRRNKSVVTFEMSIVIGTTDSSRKRKQRGSFEPAVEAQPPAAEPYDPYYDFNNYQEGYDWYRDENGDPHWYDYAYDGLQEGQSDDYWNDHDHYLEYPTPPADLIPPPKAQEDVDEKTRLCRQEELLLPSQPPQDGESSIAAAATAPSAPVFGESGEVHESVLPPATPGPPASVVSARSMDTVRARSPPPARLSDSNEVSATDDKQELERRRLMALASAPPTADVPESSNRALPLGPSAPALGEEGYRPSEDHHDLPQYER